MQLIVDQGNSVCKLALYEGERLQWSESLVQLTEPILSELFSRYNIEACIYSSVGQADERVPSYLREHCPYLCELSPTTPVPIRLSYNRSTLGGDRLAGVCGAYTLLGEEETALVVDAGTALTYEYLRPRGEYVGGNISLGLHMRAKALHSFTSRLPLVDEDLELEPWGEGFGLDTRSAIGEGVARGFVEEVRAYIDSLRQQQPELVVLLTGGDADLLARHLADVPRLRVVPELVLLGLREILKYNR